MYYIATVSKIVVLDLQTGSPRQRNGSPRRRSSVWDQEEEQAEEADAELLVRVFGAWRNLAKDSLAQKDAMEKGLAVSMMTVELDAESTANTPCLCVRQWQHRIT